MFRGSTSFWTFIELFLLLYTLVRSRSTGEQSHIHHKNVTEQLENGQNVMEIDVNV